MQMSKEEIDFLASKGWTIIANWDNRLIISSVNTYHTIFYLQSLGRHIADIKEDDIFDKDIWRVERNLLYYYKE